MAPSKITIKDSLQPHSYNNKTFFEKEAQTGQTRRKATQETSPQTDSSIAWEGREFSKEEEYTYTLNDREKAEIDNALAEFLELELDGHEINRVNFLLPNLKVQLERLAIELHRHKGFFVLRGLDPENYSHEDNLIIFLGVSSYIGNRWGQQDEAGNMLMHICNAKRMRAPQSDRPARDSNTALPFHNDLFCDIVGLQTRSCASRGGNHIICSAHTIYNKLMTTRPDILKTLASPIWTFDPRSMHAQTTKRPLLFCEDGRIIINFGRNRLLYLEQTYADQCGVVDGNVSAKQLEALHVLQETAEQNQLELAMQPGDLTYVNNFGILHSRDAFEDSTAESRYLIRVWMKNEKLAWKLPSALQYGNRNTYDGITVDQWNIMAAPRIKYDLRDKFSP